MYGRNFMFRNIGMFMGNLFGKANRQHGSKDGLQQAKTLSPELVVNRDRLKQLFGNTVMW